VRLPHTLPAVRGERVVLRSFSPLRTIGGGEVLNPLPRKPRRFSDELRHLERLESGDPAEMVTASLELAGEAGRTFAELMVATDSPRKELEKVLQSLGGKQAALLFDRDSRAYVAGSAAEALSSDMLEFMAAFHRNNPMKAGIGRGELASSWGKGKHSRLVHFLVERLLKREELALEGDLLKLPGHRVSLAADQDQLRLGIMAAYRRGDTAPPNQKDVLEELDVTRTEAAPMFKLLVEQGELVKVKEDMFFAAEAMEKLRDMVRGWFRDHDDLGPGEMRELTGLSRKYAIPLLEHFDKERLTVRVGDKRLLREKAG
jgi:selenocysteine-specific elongation factor